MLSHMLLILLVTKTYSGEQNTVLICEHYGMGSYSGGALLTAESSFLHCQEFHRRKYLNSCTEQMVKGLGATSGPDWKV